MPVEGFRPIGWTDRGILDEIEVPTDPNMPQLATVLDPRIMGRILQEELSGGFAKGRLQIERGETPPPSRLRARSSTKRRRARESWERVEGESLRGRAARRRRHPSKARPAPQPHPSSHPAPGKRRARFCSCARDTSQIGGSRYPTRNAQASPRSHRTPGLGRWCPVAVDTPAPWAYALRGFACLDPRRRRAAGRVVRHR